MHFQYNLIVLLSNSESFVVQIIYFVLLTILKFVLIYMEIQYRRKKFKKKKKKEITATHPPIHTLPLLLFFLSPLPLPGRTRMWEVKNKTEQGRKELGFLITLEPPCLQLHPEHMP